MSNNNVPDFLVTLCNSVPEMSTRSWKINVVSSLPGLYEGASPYSYVLPTRLNFDVLSGTAVLTVNVMLTFYIFLFPFCYRAASSMLLVLQCRSHMENSSLFFSLFAAG